MQGADPARYEEAISQLQTVSGQLSEDVTVLQRAGQDCVDNTEGDPAAESSSQKVQACAQQIQAAIEQVQAVIAAMQQELEEIQAAAAKAQG